MSQPEISVVIPTYNRKYLLKNCLESLFLQNYSKNEFEIIVVDDGSTDGTMDMIKEVSEKAHCGLKYLEQNNKGPAAARNFGIKNAEGDIVIFIDDDCFTNEDWINNLVKCFENEDIAGVEGKVISTEGKTPFTYQVENLKGSLYLTANIAYKKDILMEVGLFDETFPYPAGEDWDLAFRVVKSGKAILFCEGAIVTHPPRPQSLRTWLKNLNYWHSGVKLYRKHPDLWKRTTGHTIRRSFFDAIFLYIFVEGKKWRKYLIKRPHHIPKFLLMQVLRSFVLSYIFLNSYLIRLDDPP